MTLELLLLSMCVYMYALIAKFYDVDIYYVIQSYFF